MKNILLFNDISGLGNCSMVANIAVLTHLGHNVMPVATAHYSAQTAFDNYKVLLNDNTQDFAQNILSNSNVDAIYVGFCNNIATLQGVQSILQAHQDKFILVDPIFGDNGKLYSVYGSDYVAQMKEIVQLANVITPNLTEACFLADVDYNALLAHQDQPTFLATVGKAFENFLTKTGVKQAVITGVPCNQLVGNVVLTEEGARFVTNQKAPVNYSGTGDLFSSVVLGEMLKSANLLQATQLSAMFVGKCAMATERSDRRFGLDFAPLLHTLK